MTNWILLKDKVQYKDGLDLMEKTVEKVLSGQEETIYLLEHEEVYTAGTSHKSEELLESPQAPVIYTGRGGKFTYHNEGQRIIYPILNLALPNRQKDIRLYVRMLEKWIIKTLAEFGIKGFICPDRVGIWVMDNGAEKKIASIGVRVTRWVTYHGIAVNINNDLSGFSKIIPCGLADFGVTSLKELGKNITLDEFDQVLKVAFKSLFG